ncbi:YncE family protein [Terriglobus roseus]|uniref:40-residue YVTN family beta-propeller repeat-containing protein n=1 Tax=Terriglobus roseus TaxID=392734 RepID=A0A1G7GUJ5_9BACT|nr:YncE family protein [Terriglobus roseus]SDE91822.1 40-residue YVTN family beta-propeller repeat-containing protein [Terriglobus roseus]
MRFSRPGAVACFLFPLICTAQNYHVSNHWAIGGEGGWDYLLSDDAAHRLYVTHGPKVEVLDTTTGKLIGSVSGLKGTHGVALNPDGKTGYISDGGGNAIVVFDRTSLSIISTVPVGTNPDGIAYEPVTNSVWAFNGRSKNVSVMSATNNQVVATIALPGKPEFPQGDGKGYVYVNIEDKNEIVKLDAKSHTIVGTWPLSGCESPSGLAIDRAQHRLFSVCDGNKMGISDYASGKLLGLASIGDGPDAAGFDGKLHLAFSSNGQGTVSVVDTSKPNYPTIQTVTTVKGARTMAYDAATGRIFLSAAKYGAAPAPTAATPHPRPTVLPGSFEILVISR